MARRIHTSTPLLSEAFPSSSSSDWGVSRCLSLDLRCILPSSMRPTEETKKKKKKDLTSERKRLVDSISMSLMWSSLVGARGHTPLASSLLCCFASLVAGCFLSLVVGFRNFRDHHHSPSGISTVDDILQAPYGVWQPEPKRTYRLDQSTEENYKETGSDFCDSKFATIRNDIDYNFHQRYTCSRQVFQDDIIESLLELTPATTSATCTAAATTTTKQTHWAVFTAGVMGAGKSYTIHKLQEKGRFPLSQFVMVDPDAIRRRLPEFELYVQASPARAGELTRKEAGLICEILTIAALQRGHNVLVDGSLRNATWYQHYFEDLRVHYPNLQIGILHVTAPREAILQRAMSRAKVTGRIVPRDLLERTMIEVPEAIALLSPMVDLAVELRNAPDSKDIEIATPGMTWESFQNVWRPTCSSSGGGGAV